MSKLLTPQRAAEALLDKHVTDWTTPGKIKLREAHAAIVDALSLSKPEKEEIKAYKKQISELQDKLMTERRVNAKISKRGEKEEEWISVKDANINWPDCEVLGYDSFSNKYAFGELYCDSMGGVYLIGEMDVHTYITHYKIPSPPKSK